MMELILSRAVHACDFCSGRPVVASYYCRDFQYAAPEIAGETIGLMSTGDWAACRECEALIDSENWEALATRSAQEFFHHNPDMISFIPYLEMRKTMVALHHDMRENNFQKRRRA